MTSKNKSDKNRPQHTRLCTEAISEGSIAPFPGVLCRSRCHCSFCDFHLLCFSTVYKYIFNGRQTDLVADENQ